LGLKDRLGVDVVRLNRHELFIVDTCECILEGLDDLTLARVGSAYHHESVTHHDGFIKLDAFLEELFLRLNVHN
jgi:hypothetical protein